ncbi:MAG TPA: ubiquitin-like domain-containing protein [Actinospica sp.]|nr:ubiquitin-like domain-containing protein [Actinospica sp.]
MPGINEVWSLVSGTRSNPPHNPEYGDYAQGGYADLSDGQNGGYADTPYPGTEGTSEAAEYYYEDQYNQQQYRYSEYDPQGQYAESSADHHQQGLPYEPAAGYEYGQSYESGYPAQGEAVYAEASAESYGQGYEQYGDYAGYQGGYAEPSYAENAYAGERYAASTAVAVDTLVADPSTLDRSALDTPSPADYAIDSPLAEPETAPDNAPVPAPRRSRAKNAAAPTRPETKTDGVGKPPKVLRTRPRTGPLGRIVQGVVLAALVGGAVTYVAYDKSITLSIDGQTQTVHTFAGTVGAVLAADGISTGGKDVVSPAAGSSASNDETITVRYGRPLSVKVNGVSTTAWVHYPTVAGALQELGVRTSGATSSVPMSADIPRAGMSGLVVYTLRHVTFLVDGKTVQLSTTAASVTAAMAQAGIVLHNQDAPSVAAASVPTDGETISINRITGTTETKQISIPFQTTKVNDSTQYVGTTSVTTQGVDGEETVTYAVQVINGVKQAPKQISETVTKQPVNEVESVGTKALPTSASSLNWAALANCESGGNPSENTGNGFYGMYQFTISTWDSLGGSGLPSNASAATQTALAEKLYTEAGAGQWPVCGHYLFS